MEKRRVINEMNAKMSALFLLAIMALGGTGFAGAWWTAKLKITGTVTTGDFGMELSNGYWAITGDSKSIITGNCFLTDLDPVTHTHYQTLEMDLDHVYPSTDVEFTLVGIHYYGSVAGVISDFKTVVTVNAVPLSDLPDWMFCDVHIVSITANLASERPLLTVGSVWLLKSFEDYVAGSQWDYDEKLVVDIYIHWVEAGMVIKDPFGCTWGPFAAGIEVPQDATLIFTVTATIVQYNSPP